ncbi:pyrophosphatase PpaX [Paenibacillus sp. IB182496]|uniref:Pyrophosphatase PpaX n=1 Tax=Paenibacillus sabuli TaxID=2772509 RepID=A0A927BXM2_9BACL|nr:pyrophosphatase PpaX [Paenibacillus sabuli]MBD2847480.1 pyrophosphatase PpaX [Paenibacillus sabuli]
MTKIQTVLFDLDGTILDTNELIIRSFLHVLKDVAAPGFGREHIIPGMGNPLEMQFRKMSGLEDVSELVAAYRTVNLELHDEYVRLFPYVTEVVQRLHDAGIRLGVVTTKARLTTDRGLAFVGLSEWLKVTVTMDDVTHAKPHPEPILKALEALKADPARTLMIGDNAVDVEAAHAAGVTPIGVAWTLKGEQVLREAGAQHILQDMRDLYALVGLEREPLEKG